MSEWRFLASVCHTRGCTLTYQSADGLLGMQITCGGRKPDRRLYFLWGLRDSAPDYATEAEARAALQAQET